MTSVQSNKQSAKVKGKGKDALEGPALNYMLDALQILTVPGSVVVELPPEDLSNWQPPPEPEEPAQQDVEMEDATVEVPAADKPKPEPIVNISMPITQQQTIPQTEQKVSKPSPPQAIIQEPPLREPSPIPLEKSIFPEESDDTSLLPDAFSKEQLGRFAALAREHGRTLKHAGDAKMRNATGGQDCGVLEQADAVLLYVYSFWCEDLMVGRLDEKGKLTKPSCSAANWHTIFGLLGYVRNRAEKQQWPVLASFTCLLEALIIQYMQVQERRNLHSFVEKNIIPTKLSSSAPANLEVNPETTTPQSTGAAATPPVLNGMVDPVPQAHIAKFQDSFLRYSSAREKITKLFAAADDVQSLDYLRRHCPRTHKRCVTTAVRRNQVVECHPPWHFAFALDVTGGYSSLAHVVNFGRSLLEDLADAHDISYSPQSL